MKSWWIALVFVLSLNARAQSAQEPFIDWANLHNPILSYPHWSIKDCAMTYRNSVFYVFFSAFYEEHGRVRSHVAEVSTPDFKRYSQPLDWEKAFELKIPAESFNQLVPCDAAAIYDARKHDGYFYLIYAGRSEATTYLHRGWNRLALARSKDLVHWVPAGTGD
jgi:hypothetical protein